MCLTILLTNNRRCDPRINYRHEERLNFRKIDGGGICRINDVLRADLKLGGIKQPGWITQIKGVDDWAARRCLTRVYSQGPKDVRVFIAEDKNLFRISPIILKTASTSQSIG